MNRKDQICPPQRITHSPIVHCKGCGPMLAIFLLIPLFAGSSSAAAKPQFSLPGLNALQKKFNRKYRRKRKARRRKKQSKPKTPIVLAPALADLKNQLTAPPLPMRNPRKLKRKKNNRSQTALRRAMPPLPVRKPRREKRTKFKQPPENHKQNPANLKTTRPAKTKAKNAVFVPTQPPLPTRKPHRHPSKITEADWSPAVLKEAARQCAALGEDIKRLPAVKKGLCGNPAPVLLGKIGSTTVQPAATLSCPMVVSLLQWFSQSVQPLAEKHFGKKVQKIRNVSSYVCRNRYGDTKTRISEHAYANALDIAWFELQGGNKISVLDDWDNKDGKKSIFLHELHRSACKLFGTVLGPDANAAHKDHFHLDKAPRKRTNYCR